MRASISRRQFLGVSGAGLALLAGGEVFDLGREVLAQEQAWLASGASNNDFLQKHFHRFKNVSIGASFAPEQWRLEVWSPGTPLEGLDWAVREIGIRQLRLGLRWSRVEPNPGVIDLSYYRPYLDYAFEHRLDICLNVGPIKVFRWPEEHVPSWVDEQVDLPAVEASVEPGSALAATASTYLDQLLRALISEYGLVNVQAIPIVQVENEPFYPLGSHRWGLSKDYLKALVRQLDEAFPRSRFLLTTAARLNFEQVRDVFTDLMKDPDRYRDRFIMGFDYHYKTPRRDSYPILRHLDPITFGRFGLESCERNRELAKALGYDIEVTEGQAEPYGHLTSPGNSAREFRFMLLRCAENVLDPEKPSLVRVWGIEELAKKAIGGRMSSEHLAIVDLTQQLNAPGV